MSGFFQSFQNWCRRKRSEFRVIWATTQMMGLRSMIARELLNCRATRHSLEEVEEILLQGDGLDVPKTIQARWEALEVSKMSDHYKKIEGLLECLLEETKAE